MENINFDELLGKLKEVIMRAGHDTTKQIICMHLALKDEKTPTTDKIIIYSTLAHIVMPSNILSLRNHPIFSHLDEVAAVLDCLQENKEKNHSRDVPTSRKKSLQSIL